MKFHKKQGPIYSYNVIILKITIHLETTTIFHTYYAWEASYNFEVGELSETTQKLETRSVRLHANNMFGHNALLITSFFPVFLLLKEVIH